MRARTSRHRLPGPEALARLAALSAGERPVRVIVVGSRTVSDRAYVFEALDRVLARLDPRLIEIVSGTARGADRLGEAYAAARGLPLRRFPADWARHGRAAGFRRNEAMAAYATHLVAFWDGRSRGTRHMIETARRAGLRVRVLPAARRRT